MPSLSLRTEDAFTSTATIRSTSCATTTTTKSLFALSLHALSLCVILVVVVALLLLSLAVVGLLLPVACMAASVCLLCATAARLLVPSVPPGRTPENRGGVRERKHNCGEAPAGGFGNGGVSSADKQEPGRSLRFSSFDEELSGSCWDDDAQQQGRFFFVDTSSYCRTFYDLLAFWRSMERKATGGHRSELQSVAGRPIESKET